MQINLCGLCCIFIVARMEQERRRQMELDKMLARQREMEAEQEEQRRKMIEQREVMYPRMPYPSFPVSK